MPDDTTTILTTEGHAKLREDIRRIHATADNWLQGQGNLTAVMHAISTIYQAPTTNAAPRLRKPKKAKP